ncbi:hypothetical protein [Herbaspirillum sp. C9C3]|uniref:hypothetical protein n=1 Tax=Herbaspirillum sp. C9C3 TaxID=2735271 RepID=UPI0015857DEE|nr:hypothetical protein [Herbaspirillum sp. C9C3]NUT62002.1 hypothetical protein [Herbaspirillum sp. C9C3]
MSEIAFNFLNPSGEKSMLSRRQWQWCADHELGIKLVLLYLFLVFLLVYTYNFLSVFWWNNKIPLQHHLNTSLAKKLNCFDGDGRNFFIEDGPTSPPLGREDGSTLLLEAHFSTSFGSEILEKRPECLAAYIADTVGWPEPYAMFVIDRKTGKTIFRITYLRAYLNR